jgi:alkanesulfonate monooxygenase SsuD/methylene tetrahydromethanopterin reductase-like flavin-dependent oxidoreductase (luciferase family)
LSIGIRLVQPPAATAAAALRTAALAAEALGYRTLWLADDLLADGPPGPGRPPVPIDALAGAAHLAALTTRVRIGVAGLDAGAHDPAALVQALATIDQLSAGRLTVSLAGGARGWAADALLDDMARNWPPEAAPDGAPPAVGPPPVQLPRPPILAAIADHLDLDLRVSDEAGSHGPGRPVDGLHVVDAVPEAAWRPVWEGLVAEAAAQGRDGDDLHLVVQVAVDPGDPAAAAGALAAALAGGATEVVLAVPRSTGLDEALAAYAEAAEAIELRARG